jgi:hypothetical protein
LRFRAIERAALTAIAVVFAAAPLAPAQASESDELQVQIQRLEQEIAAQRELITSQARRLDEQQKQIDAMRSALGFDLGDLHGRGLAQTGTTPTPLPSTPVGEAPPESEPIERAEVRAIPREQGVLTQAGELVFDPSIEYTRSSANRLVFRGIELIPGIQIGVIEATDADRDTLVGTAALRFGLTDRLEIEGRLPYLHRNDRIEVVQQRDEGLVRNIELRKKGIGDAEVSLRYQINPLRPLKPIWIASLRVKSDTGVGPFGIPFDSFGIATGLATGSGFWAVQPGLSFLLPSDPVVIYGGGAYLFHLARDVDKDVGDVFIGRVDPGDAVSANIGFGFALNPRFSFSLGYRHNYIFPTHTEVGDSVQSSNKLHVGQFNFGMAYRVTEKQTVNLGFEFGVTSDAPDVSITIRTPLVLLN